MSVYKALGAAVRKKGKIQLPDGKVYIVTALTMGELLDIEAAQSDEVTEVEAMRTIANIASRCSGAPLSVILDMDPKDVGHLIACAQVGVDAVIAALSAEAEAGGNGAVPAKVPATKKVSTSRNRR